MLAPTVSFTTPVEALKAAAKSFSAAGSTSTHRQRAQQLAFWLMRSYWHTACVQKGLQWRCAPCFVGELDCPPLDAPLASLVLSAAELFAADPDAAYTLGSIYSSMLPQEVRSENGVFYTPPVLVERLVNHITAQGYNWRCGRVLDPGCGSGVFLVAVARQMVAARAYLSPGECLSSIAMDLCGWELDPFSAWMAQVCVEVSLLDLAVLANRRLPCVVVAQDALLAEHSEQFALVIGNPPYGKVTLSPELRDQYQRSVFGHANLYGLFTDLAVRMSADGGLIAFVTPTSFLGGAYFKALREILLQHAPPVRIDFVEARSGVFDDVLQETVLAVFARGGIASDIGVYSFTNPQVLLETALIATMSTPTGTSPWLLPRSGTQARLLNAITAMSGRLTDYGLAISTGPLVWNRHKPQLYTAPQKGLLPIIWAESLSSDGFKLKSDLRNHASHIDVLDGQAHLISRSPMILLQRTTSKEQSRRLVCGLLTQRTIDQHGGVVVENHVNMIRHKKAVEGISLEAVLTLLSSQVVDSVFRCISGSVAVSAYELNTLPVPSVTDMKELTAMLTAGEPKERVDIFIETLYGALN